MEYLDGYSTAIRCVARKVGLYVLEMISLQRCYFQMGGLAYDTLTDHLFINYSTDKFSPY